MIHCKKLHRRNTAFILGVSSALRFLLRIAATASTAVWTPRYRRRDAARLVETSSIACWLGGCDGLGIGYRTGFTRSASGVTRVSANRGLRRLALIRSGARRPLDPHWAAETLHYGCLARLA